MSIREFTSLNYMDQFQCLWDWGTKIAHYKGHAYSVNLFSLGGFYVEVYYSNKEDKILSTSTFSSLTPVEKYLDCIDITELTAILKPSI